MNYQDILKEVGGTSIGNPPESPSQIGPGTLATRESDENENHHLWNNRGTWWCHFTLHRPDYTSERIRVSLKTRDLSEARIRRDELLHALK
jgi:hypothetical protein